MTIVETHDTRNAEWTKSNIGSKMLEKMGWSEGQGLGKRRQGTTTALRAVRLTENMGIGASTATEDDAWHATGHDFASVLTNLQQTHASDDKKKKKKSKKKKKDSLTLARNKVTAGHAQKMRRAKDLSNKSDDDMAAIFGKTHKKKKRKAEDEQVPDKKRRKEESSSSDPSSSDNDVVEKKKSKKSKKKKSKKVSS